MKQSKIIYLKFSLQENRNFCRSVSVTSNSSASSDSRLKMVSNSSSQALVSGGLVQRGLSVDEPLSEEEIIMRESSPQEMKFEQKRVSATSKMKVSSSDGYTAEKIAATNQERKRLQTGSMSYEEKSASAAMKQKLETESFSAEKVIVFSLTENSKITIISGWKDYISFVAKYNYNYLVKNVVKCN